MGGEWSHFTLGELCSLITDGKHGDCENERNSGFYFLSVKDVVGGRLIYENSRQITERDFLDTHRRTNLEPGDILFTNTGTIGRMAIAQNDARTYCTTFQKSVAILKPRRTIVTSRFLYYLLHFDNAKLSDFAAGTTQKNLLLKDLRSFSVQIPPLAEQRAIAHILGTLDDKIELNRRRNLTLEAMAHALFQDWFVDFGPVRAKLEGRAPYLPTDLWNRFPDRLDDDGKPEGWEEKPLDEVAEFLNGLALQKFPATGLDDSLPVIKIAELRNGVSAKSDRASREVPAKYIVKDSDFLFSWSGSLLAKFWTEGEGALNQHLFKVSSNQYPMWFVSHWVHHHLEEFQAIAASKATTMGHIQRGHLKAAMTLCPPDDVLQRMGLVIAPLVEKAIRNELESRTLIRLRDTLLPKLISGELRIADAERFVSEAAP